MHGSLKLLLYLQLIFTSVAHAELAAIVPVPPPELKDTPKYLLGKKLFEDPLFSSNHSLSCNSCHSLQKAGTDGLPRYIGMNKVEGALNTPTVFNARLNFKQFWDGRAKNLSAVIDDHITDKTVFSNSWEAIIEEINKNDDYVSTFKTEYLVPHISDQTVKDALTVYLNNLMTPHSAFDRYLDGDETALSEDAKKGYALFIQYGCETCHQGPSMGGNLFQKLGIYKDYYAGRTTVPADLGMYNITKNESDKYIFKVPSLRNITLTAPYLHDGSIKTLEEIIEIMGIYQVGQPIPKFEIDYIIKFLESLNGLQAPP